MGSSRVTIDWCDSSMRMKVGLTKVSSTRPEQAEVWAKVTSVKDRVGRKLRLNCYNDAKLSGSSHQISVGKGEVDLETLAADFIASSNWQPIAIAKWLTKYPEPLMKEEGASKPKDNKTAKQGKKSSPATKRPSEGSGQSTRRVKKQKVEEEHPDEALHSQAKKQFSPQELEKAKTRWNDLSIRISEDDVEAMRVITMSQSHTSQPPSADLLKAIRQDALLQSSVDDKYDVEFMWEDPRWKEWSSTYKRVERKEEPTATFNLREEQNDLWKVIMETDKVARRLKG